MGTSRDDSRDAGTATSPHAGTATSPDATPRTGGTITAVAGATGRVSRQVVADLLTGGPAGSTRGRPMDPSDLVLLSRTPERAVETLTDPERGEPVPQASKCDIRVGDYTDPEGMRRALAGVDTFFMVSMTESAGRVDAHRAAVAAARDAGVRHIVYLSFVGAAEDAVFTHAREHHATEQALRAAAADSGPEFTILRDSFYTEVTGQFIVPDPWRDSGEAIAGPAADGRTGFVTTADVAACAAAVLRDPAAHRGRTYTLTGPEALTLGEVVEIVRGATGRDVRYVDETLAQARASRAGYGAPDWEVDAWISTYTAIAAGELDVVSDAVLQLTGTPPESVAAWWARRAG